MIREKTSALSPIIEVDMKIFRYPADRIPTLVITLLSVIDFLLYLAVDSPWILLLWLVLMIMPKGCICAWNHHHQHVPTFRYVWMNRLLEVLYGLHTGITTNVWVLHHVLGHHVNYLDQSVDESRWKRDDGTEMGEFEYTLTTAVTGYPRAFGVGKRYPKYQSAFIGWGLFVFILVATLIYFRPLQGILIYALPMVIGLLVTCWATYDHHAGLDTDNHLEASYNITHRWYNILTGNLGYHTAHHMKQGLHWSKLPEFHAQIVDQIPPHLYQKPFILFRLLPG